MHPDIHIIETADSCRLLSQSARGESFLAFWCRRPEQWRSKPDAAYLVSRAIEQGLEVD